MDDRRRALQEILDLLKAEGWDSEDAGEDFPAKKPIKKVTLRPNSILTVISLATTATCLILLGAYQSLLGARDANLSVRYVRPVNPAASLDPQSDRMFATIDGQWAWGDKKTTRTMISDDGKEVDVYETAIISAPIAMDTRNLVQLWHRRPDGGAYLIGQSVVSPNQSDGDEFIIRINDINNSGNQFVVGLSIDQKSRRKVASSGTRVEN